MRLRCAAATASGRGGSSESVRRRARLRTGGWCKDCVEVPGSRRSARFRSSAGSRILPKHSGVLTQCQGVARGVFKPPLVQAWLASILLPLASWARPANEAQDRRYSCGSTASRVAERVLRSRRAALGPSRKLVPRKNTPGCHRGGGARCEAPRDGPVKKWLRNTPTSSAYERLLMASWSTASISRRRSRAAATGSSRTRTATTRAACREASTPARYTARRSRNDLS